MKKIPMIIIAVLAAQLFCLSNSFSQTPLYRFDFDGDSDSTMTLEKVTGTSFSIDNHFNRPERINGIVDQALRFDGFSTWASGNLSLSGISDQLSIELWYATEAFNEQPIGLISQQSSQGGFSIKIGSYGAVRFEIFADGSRRTLTTQRKLERYRWNHIVAQVDLGLDQMKIYVNGELWSVRTIEDFNNLGLASTTLFIGRPNAQTTHNGFNITTANGAIDQINLYGDTLSPSQILTNSQLGVGKIPDLLVKPEVRHPDDHLRPRYHPMPNTLWANEAYGLTYYNNRYHLFFQKNPNHADLYFMHWGHASSPDLVQWREEKMPLAPEEGFSDFGVWSGTTVFDSVGKPVISYTGVNGAFAGIGMAFAKDDSLIEWERYVGDPVVPRPPAGTNNLDFRDPYIWHANGQYYMIVGSGYANDGGGTLFTYTSPDLVSWTNIPDLYANPNIFDSGIFWEMPAFFQLTHDIWVLVVTPVFKGGRGAETLYWMGTFNGGKFIPFDEEPKEFELLKRNLLSPAFGKDSSGNMAYIGIIPETRDVQDQIAAAWRQTFSIPRVVRLLDDSLFGHYPHPNLCRLRRNPVQILNRDFITNTSDNLTEIAGNQTEIEAIFVPGPDADFSLRLLSNASGTEYTEIDFNTKINRLGLDLRNSSPFNAQKENRFNTYFFGDTIHVRIFLDHSTIEVFVDNLTVVSARVYPGEGSIYADLIVNEGSVFAPQIDAWDLANKEVASGTEVCPPSSLPGSFPTSIEEEVLDGNGLRIMPNAVQDWLRFELMEPLDTHLTAEIYDLQGKLIDTKVLATKVRKTWNVSQLSSGLYLLNIKTENGSISKRFLKR